MHSSEGLKLIDGKDVFAALPMGFGKSLCFACLPGVFDVMSLTLLGCNASIALTTASFNAFSKLE